MKSIVTTNRVLILVLLLTGGVVFGQQMPQYSQYQFNNYILNPAVGGTYKHIDILGGYRTQWTGFDGHPETFFVTAHGPINYPDKNTHRKTKPHHGIGGMFFKDKTGPTSWTGAYASYAIHKKINKTSFISLGAFVGMKQYKLDGNALQFIEHQDDPTISPITYTSTVPDGNIGLWYYNDKMFAGLSMNQVFNSNLRLSTGNLEDFGKLDNHFFMTAGYLFSIDRFNKLIPSVMIKSVSPAPVSIDVNIRYVMDDKYWLAVSYRYHDAVSFIAGMVIQNIELGYAYDVTLTDVRRVSRSVHEIIVGYRLMPGAKHINCPAKYW